MQMTLHRALTRKNTLVGEIRKLAALLKEKNSYNTSLPESTRVDTRELLSEYLGKKDKLTILKSRITEANVKLYPLLAELEEAKDTLKFLESLPTKQGTFENINFGMKTTETYSVWLSEVDIREKAQAWAKEIENLQDKIDEYNATHFIEFDEGAL